MEQITIHIPLYDSPAFVVAFWFLAATILLSIIRWVINAIPVIGG